MKIQLKILVFSCVIFLLFSSTVFAFNAGTSRLIPSDTVSVYQDGKIIGEFTKEVPLIENQMLASKGRCGIITDTMSLVAEDKTFFSIGNKSDTDYVQVENGTIFFGITQPTGSLVFVTPKGAVTVHQVLLNAASDNRMVEGYIKVSEGTSEIGVTDGGSLYLLSQNGKELVTSGNRFILAQADLGNAPASPPPANQEESDNRKGGWWNLSNGQLAGIGAGVVALGVGGYFIKRNNDDGGGKAQSPARPQ